MTASESSSSFSQPKPSKSNRFYHIFILSAAFFLIFSCHNTFLFSAFTMFPNAVSETILPILTISYGVFNAFTGFLVSRMGYKTSLLVAGALSLPFYVVATVAKKLLASRPPPSRTLLGVFYVSGGVCGLGQSILWITQGCYIANTTAPEDMSTAFSIFNVAYNFTVCVGTGYMAWNGSVNRTKATAAAYAGSFWSNDIVSLLLLCAAALLGVFLFALLPKEKAKVGEAEALTSPSSAAQPRSFRLRSQAKALLRNFVDVSLVVPAMCFLGIFITFSNVALQSFVSDAENTFQYLTTAAYGLAMTLNSCFQWAFLRTSHLKICIAAAGLLQAACYVSLLAFDLQGMSPSLLKRTLVMLFSVVLGVGDSFFITGFYTFLSLRYEASIEFTMTLFMVLNGVFGGVLAQSFENSRWGLILLLLAIPTYAGIFLEMQRVKLE